MRRITIRSPRSSRRAGAVAALAGAAIAVLALCTATLPATAATPAQNRYSSFVQGDFTVTGNTLIAGGSFSWLDSDADPSIAGEPANAADSIASSRAGFVIPPGSSIVRALLYAFQDYGGVADPIGPSTLLFAGPGQGYADVALTEIGRDSNQARLLYSDVTPELPASTDGDVWVGVPASGAPVGSVRSWALFVIYAEPGAPWRQVVITDQAHSIDASFPITSATVSDLVLAPSGQSDMTLAEYTFYSSVGHADTLQVCAGVTTCAVGAGILASNAANPVNDIANLTMTVDAAPMPDAFPASTSNRAFTDLDLFSLDDVTLPAGTTSATITQRTSIDTLFNGVNALSMTTFAPIPSLVDTIAPSSAQQVDDELTYRLELSLDAVGDSATGVVITDVVPPEASYVPGSATITGGWNAGAVTDAAGDDQVDFAGSTLTWRIGSGADGSSGGTLAPGDGNQVLTFRVVLDNAAVNDVVSDDATGTMSGVANPLLGYTVAASASTDPLALPPGPVAPAKTSTGVGTTEQQVTLAVPSGGSVALFDGGAPATSVNVPGEGGYLLDPATGVVTFTPELGFAGTATPIGYRVADRYAQSASSTYTPAVVAPPPPAPPALTSVGPLDADQTVAVPIPGGGSVSLMDGPTPVTSLAVPGEGGYVLDLATGVIRFRPVPGFSGAASPIGVRVTDAYGQSSTGSYTATVTDMALTGIEPGVSAAVALMLLVTGGALLAARRRRPAG